ncbi:hypothetical protein BDY17DRAFT_86580 [Neohortaea acidophila]|uniref:Uncharacterized protein n=1 Tax=Neohortaea acidophila TaxID=245834 RepID=A0A6A6Q4D0_9PEZI|nr:uncharacterized protein BDY17DRAFT_86580 [Neohortaea acidophila]KAF2486816.1 hypothetical protein BDY17DRAFT_86580 [Neohortaea acidophila]
MASITAHEIPLTHPPSTPGGSEDQVTLMGEEEGGVDRVTIVQKGNVRGVIQDDRDIDFLFAMLAQLDIFPGHENEDIYGKDAKLEITSPTFQWLNATAASEGACERGAEGGVCGDCEEY